MNNSEVCWDDFVDFCEDNGINLEHEDDWAIKHIPDPPGAIQ